MKIFDQAAARTGLRDREATAAGFAPVTVASQADDHKAYYPGSHRITMRVTGDRTTGRLLGVQLFGHRHAEIAKRIDIAAAAIFNSMTVDAVSDLDLSYTPPLGSPWEAVQMGAQAWLRATPRHTNPAPDLLAEEQPCQPRRVTTAELTATQNERGLLTATRLVCRFHRGTPRARRGPGPKRRARSRWRPCESARSFDVIRASAAPFRSSNLDGELSGPNAGLPVAGTPQMPGRDY